MVQDEAFGADLGSPEPTTDKKDKKEKAKKKKNAAENASPLSGKDQKKKKKEAKDSQNKKDDSATEHNNEPAKKKKDKQKKETKFAESPEVHEDEGALEEARKDSKPRKSTLLLCDNAAAAALGNLVAIQVVVQQGMATRSEGSEGEEAPHFLDEMDEEELEEITANTADFEKKVAELKSSIIASSVKPPQLYFDKLREVTRADALTIGEAREDDIIAIEHKEAQARMAVYTTKQKEFQEQQQRLLLYEQVVRKRILEDLEKKEAKFNVLKRQAEKQDCVRQNHLVKLLRECECRMESLMRRRRARLSSVYGLLQRQGEFTAVNSKEDSTKQQGKNSFIPLGKAYRVEWLRAPQPLRIRIDLCRALKDKVLPGRYVISVSIWTRIGGSRLRWGGLKKIEEKIKDEPALESQEEGSFLVFVDGTEKSKKTDAHPAAAETAAATKFVEFGARYNDECLRFDDTLELACPSEVDVEPGMCLVFELFLLRGPSTPFDKVVGWGAFPLVDSDFRLIEGSFKVALLRGPVDPSVRRYIDMEETISKSLDAWLCNLYFRCQPLPKYSRGQVEFELRLEHAAALLGGQKQDTLQEKSQKHKQVWGNLIERGKADDLVQQLISALDACEQMSEGSGAVVSKDGVRAWRHTEPPATPFTNADINTLQEYGYSVYCGTTLSHPREASRKLKYLKSSLLDDFRPSSGKREICTLVSAVACAVLALWCCTAIFALGVWISLRIAKVAVHTVEFVAFYVRLEFVQEILSLNQTIITSVAGPLACLVAFALASVILHIANLTLGRQPSPVYQFLSPFGAFTTLSPILMLVIEGIRGEKDGATFLLADYYLRDVNNMTFGVIISLIIDLAFIGLCSMVYYIYAIKIHRQGQVEDTHRRLTGDESLFSLPMDVEISERYLRWCCDSAKEYRGPEGEVRRVYITQYPMEKPKDTVDKPKRRRIFPGGRKHSNNDLMVSDLTICTLKPKTETQTLYRRFVRHHDGTIVEVIPAPAEEEKPSEVTTQVTTPQELQQVEPLPDEVPSNAETTAT